MSASFCCRLVLNKSTAASHESLKCQSMLQVKDNHFEQVPMETFLIIWITWETHAGPNTVEQNGNVIKLISEQS